MISPPYVGAAGRIGTGPRWTTLTQRSLFNVSPLEQREAAQLMTKNVIPLPACCKRNGRTFITILLS